MIFSSNKPNYISESDEDDKNDGNDTDTTKSTVSSSSTKTGLTNTLSAKPQSDRIIKHTDSIISIVRYFMNLSINKLIHDFDSTLIVHFIFIE